MTRDDIIRMAREAGLCDSNGEDDDSVNIARQPQRFAALVAALAAAAEREECAKVCDKLGDHEAGDSCEAMYRCADAIRVRGNT